MQELALHILDIAENAVAAGAKKVEIKITEDLEKDQLVIEISDDGRGMTREFANRAADPFVTTRTERKAGFGLSLFAEAAHTSNGKMVIRSRPRRGTRVRATFQHSHIDRQPLGNVGETLLTLIVGWPQVDFSYHHRKDSAEFSMKSRDLKAQLKGGSLSSPEGLRVLRKKLEEDVH